MLKIFLLSSSNEKNTAVPEVLSETGPEAGPGGALSCTKNHKGEAGWYK